MTLSSSTSDRRVALVTGASAGIGRACAAALLADGWEVVYAGRRVAALDSAIADAAVGDPSVQGREHAVSCDVSSDASVSALFDTVRQRCGRLDLLFNNAGTF